MKTIFKILTVCGLFITTGCNLFPVEDLRDGNFFYKNDFDFYPKKDTFKVGDTLWLMFSIPKNIKNNDFDYTFDEDTLKCLLDVQLSKISSSTDTPFFYIASVNIDYDIFFKKGSSIPHNATSYFIFDNETQKYLNEFGFVIQDTGKMVIRGRGYKEFFIIGIEQTINKKYNKISPDFYSTFISSSEGWFQFEVVE